MLICPRLFIAAFPSSEAFDIINNVLTTDEAERKEAISKAKTIVGITLKNAKGEEASWYVDVKDKGVAGVGTGPPGGKSEGMLFCSITWRCSISNITFHSYSYPLRR